MTPNDRAPAGRGPDSGGPLATVHILGLPLDLVSRANQHWDELLREFAVIRTEGHQDLPSRLLDLVQEATAKFANFADLRSAAVAAAVARGDTSVDVEFKVPFEVREACLRLEALLAESDEFCREGATLLTLASPPDIAEFRRWYLGQFVEQIDGGAPTPWPAHASRPADLIARTDVQGDQATVRVAGELDLGTAARLRSVLVEVQSRPVTRVVVDLAGVRFVDSTGLSVLIAAWKRLCEQDRVLVLRAPRPNVRQLLNVSGLSQLLLVEPAP